MHTVSALWQEMIQNPLVSKNEKIIIAGTEYGVSQLVGGTVEEALMSSSFEIGNAVSREIQVKLFPRVNIPRTAKIERQVQLVILDADGKVSQESEWIPKGTFYTDLRVKSPNGMFTLTAYDAMLKADSVWPALTDGEVEWPISMADAVADIASILGIEVDTRNEINSNYKLSQVSTDTTMREVLCTIAAAHGGVFCISDFNTLRLVTFGPIDTTQSTGFLNIGKRLGHFESSVALGPVERVTLYYDEERYYTAGKEVE